MTVSTEKQTDSSVFPRTFHEAHDTTCKWWPEFWRYSKAPCNSGGRSPEPSIRLSLSSGGDGEGGGGVNRSGHVLGLLTVSLIT